MKKSVRKGGFTLPEVLVTVTVVAVLAAVVVPAVTQFVGKGDTPASQQDIQALQNGISAFSADVRAFPGGLHQLTTALAASDSAAGSPIGPSFTATQIANWKGPYFSGALTGTPSTFVSSGLAFTIGDTLKVVTTGTNSTWLQDSLVSTTPNTCAGLLHLDSLLDNHDGASSGLVVWTGTCAQGTPTGDRAGAAIRLVPVSK